MTIDPSNTDKSYSQYGQDKFIDEHIFKGKLKNGFFVEAGAADGVEDSKFMSTVWDLLTCCWHLDGHLSYEFI